MDFDDLLYKMYDIAHHRLPEALSKVPASQIQIHTD